MKEVTRRRELDQAVRLRFDVGFALCEIENDIQTGYQSKYP